MLARQYYQTDSTRGSLTNLDLSETEVAVLPVISDLNGEVFEDEVDILETVDGNVNLPAEVDVGLVVGVEPEADLQAGGREVPEAVV